MWRPSITICDIADVQLPGVRLLTSLVDDPYRQALQQHVTNHNLTLHAFTLEFDIGWNVAHNRIEPIVVRIILWASDNALMTPHAFAQCQVWSRQEDWFMVTMMLNCRGRNSDSTLCASDVLEYNLGSHWQGLSPPTPFAGTQLHNKKMNTNREQTIALIKWNTNQQVPTSISCLVRVASIICMTQQKNSDSPVCTRRIAWNCWWLCQFHLIRHFHTRRQNQCHRFQVFQHFVHGVVSYQKFARCRGCNCLRDSPALHSKSKARWQVHCGASSCLARTISIRLKECPGSVQPVQADVHLDVQRIRRLSTLSFCQWCFGRVAHVRPWSTRDRPAQSHATTRWQLVPCVVHPSLRSGFYFWTPTTHPEWMSWWMFEFPIVESRGSLWMNFEFPPSISSNHPTISGVVCFHESLCAPGVACMAISQNHLCMAHVGTDDCNEDHERILQLELSLIGDSYIKLRGVVHAIHTWTRRQVPSSWHGVGPLMRPRGHSHAVSLPSIAKFAWGPCNNWNHPGFFFDIVHSAALFSSDCWWRLYPLCSLTQSRERLVLLFVELRFPSTQSKKCAELAGTAAQCCWRSTLNKHLKTWSSNAFKFNPICRSRRIPRCPSVSGSRVAFLSFVMHLWLDFNVCQCFALVCVAVGNEVICFGVMLTMLGWRHTPMRHFCLVQCVVMNCSGEIWIFVLRFLVLELIMGPVLFEKETVLLNLTSDCTIFKAFSNFVWVVSVPSSLTIHDFQQLIWIWNCLSILSEPVIQHQRASVAFHGYRFSRHYPWECCACHDYDISRSSVLAASNPLFRPCLGRHSFYVRCHEHPVFTNSTCTECQDDIHGLTASSVGQVEFPTYPDLPVLSKCWIRRMFDGSFFFFYSRQTPISTATRDKSSIFQRLQHERRFAWKNPSGGRLCWPSPLLDHRIQEQHFAVTVHTMPLFPCGTSTLGQELVQ